MVLRTDSGGRDSRYEAKNPILREARRMGHTNRFGRKGWVTPQATIRALR
jgi:hypothetical protein